MLKVLRAAMNSPEKAEPHPYLKRPNLADFEFRIGFANPVRCVHINHS